MRRCLRLTRARNLARLREPISGRPYVGGDTFQVWSFRKRVQRVGVWLLARWLAADPTLDPATFHASLDEDLSGHFVYLTFSVSRHVVHA